jgi:hypothetical protein
MSIDSPSPIATLLEITMWNHQRQNINVFRVSADFLTTGSNEGLSEKKCVLYWGFATDASRKAFDHSTQIWPNGRHTRPHLHAEPLLNAMCLGFLARDLAPSATILDAETGPDETGM